ncbi:hypothetical protein N7533_009778 [Penicillium manginii]|uniref:uncharacterized protein n=1 Tax=Penicillium manginii TaxID=203109 RepID=UPI00254837F4|nr:uncharacterized protein N7533_009778 [Penicillium manginii]KAJ5744908.1 hypothetical protein N7533_009778 [Penicillium manginii]
MQYSMIIASILSVTLAQKVAIGAPARGAQVEAGSEVTVQVQRPNTLTGSAEIGIAVAIGSNNANPNEQLGNVLYKGIFEPELHERNLPAYQNVTVTVPAQSTKGYARINVAHAGLVGAGNSPFLETVTWPITIV